MAMGDNRQTTYHNIAVLVNLGFSRVGNTSVFQKDARFILSPADAHSLFMLRIVPNLFMIKSLRSLSSLLTERLMQERRHSGKVWGNNVEMGSARVGSQVFIVSKGDKNCRVRTTLLNQQQVIAYFQHD